MRLIRNLLLSLFFIIAVISCEKEKFITTHNSGISFSLDTLYFDTVFTTLGTVTKSFTIHNPYKEYITISRIYLGKGESSVYRINVDGSPGTDFRNIQIPPKDSIYVFVEATLDPNNSDGLLLQQDSVVTETNGKIQDIDLMAWGQDVHIIRGEYVGSQTWMNDKPYLIIDGAAVDSGQILTIEPGVRVYFHKGAVLYVFGTLRAEGQTDLPITFAGDRLEQMYQDIPGQWGGIWLYAGSHDNVMDNVDLRCGNFGVRVDTFMNSNPTLTLSNSFLGHFSSVGILARGSTILGWNNVFADCGQSAIALLWGGSYEFYQCTIANRWQYNPTRQVPSVVLNNYYPYNDTVSGVVYTKYEIRDLDKAYFGNCIIWGNMSSELYVDRYSPETVLNYKFENCLTKFHPDSLNLSDTSHFTNLINYPEEGPRFVSWDDYDFELDSVSPAINAGLLSIGERFPTDKLGNSRLDVGNPDIGAFERVDTSGSRR